MKVAVLHDLGAGGARRRLAEQVAHLSARDGVSVVEVTTSAAEPVTMRPVVVPLRQRAPQVHPVLRPPLRYRDLHELRAAWRRMGELAAASGADVVLANPDRFLRGAVPVGGGLPVVRFCDEPRRIDHEPELGATLRPATRRLYADLRRREARTALAGVTEAAVLLTNSRYSVGAIRRAYGRPARVVPSGVPAAMTPDGPASAPHLLSVGTLLPTKGHDLAVEAAARSGLGLPLTVVAHRGDPAQERRLLDLAAAHGVVLTFRLGIDDTELATLYRGAVALCYLAVREPLGLASLEAQACGCPVVVADEGGLPETVAPGAGQVVRRDAGAAAQALVALAASGHRPAPRAVSWASSAEHLHRCLADVVRRGRGGAAVVDLTAARTGARGSAVPAREG